MSDYGYRDLDAAIDEMARGAIDLDLFTHHDRRFRARGKYGVTEGWVSTDGVWEITGGGTLKLRMPNEHIPYTPGDTVHDPHRWIGFDPHEVIHAWRPRIAKAFHPWATLPDPGGFADDVATWRKAVRTLTLAVPVEHGQGSGAVNTALVKDVDFLATFALSGATMDAFKLNVGLPLRGFVVPFQRNVSAVAQVCLQAEATLWGSARRDLAQIANSSVAAFAQVTDSKPADLSGALTVLGTVASVMSVVPEVGPVAGAAGTVLDIIQDLVSDAAKPARPEKYHVEGSTAAEVLASVGHALHHLNLAVRSEETRIQKLCTSMAHTIAAHPNSFDVGRGAQRLADDHDRASILPRDPGPGSTIHLDYQTLGTVADRCHRVSAEFNDARRGMGPTTSSTPWLRDDAVGLGPAGPFHEWASMVLALDHSIQHSSHYLDEAAATMRLFVKEARQTDEVADAALTRHVRHVHAADARQHAAAGSGRGG